MIKETGIIMSGNHPKLILDGIKTMTRRVIKPQPIFDGADLNGKPYYAWKGKDYSLWVLAKMCAYGQVGDRLWVRETHKYFNSYMLGDQREDVQIVEYKDGVCKDISDKLDPDWWETDKLGKWRSARFLHKWASRITLEITGVRVERVQEITWKDTHKEGILRFDRDNPDPTNGGMGYNRGATGLPVRYESIDAFMDLWDSLNAKRGYGWEVNPWVWVISFNLVNISTTNV